MDYMGDLGQFFDELDAFRKELRKHNDYLYVNSVGFYVGRGVWKIRVQLPPDAGVDKTTRIERRAKKFFPGQIVVAAQGWVYWNVSIYFHM